MVKILQELYKDTRAQIWDGTQLSDSFPTSCGVKQGCVLSPLLFALFINDLENQLETGLTIGDIQIKALMYSDDIVILSDDPVKLQRMILKLECYCKTWNLIVNLNKSKIMIFQRGGGIRGQNERWLYEGNEIDIVNKYTYLGILLTPKLSMSENMKQRLQSAKISINCTWKNFLYKKDVKLSEKLKLFSAVSRSVLCYGAQVWGFMQFDDVEKLQRFFLKRLLSLPQQAPNYALTLETKQSNLYIYTLNCHFSYLCRVLFNYGHNRLPYKLAWLVVQKEIYWFDTWLELAEKHNVVINLRENSIHNIKRTLGEIVAAEDAWIKRKAYDRAQSTVRHGLYDKLEYNNEPNYFSNEFSLKKISLILKYRCGLIDLNASPWRREGSHLCSLCNMLEEEDLLHFLGTCPILAEFRLQVCGKRNLTEKEVIDILNGKNNYNELIHLVTKAWKYRNFLVREYNC